jgi:hypothetical protein
VGPGYCRYRQCLGRGCVLKYIFFILLAWLLALSLDSSPEGKALGNVGSGSAWEGIMVEFFFHLLGLVTGSQLRFEA